MRFFREGFRPADLPALVVLAAVALGAAIPAVNRWVIRRDQSQVKYSLRQLGLACVCYHDVHKGLPPAFVSPATPAGPLGLAVWPSGLSGTCHVGLGPYYENNARALVNSVDDSLEEAQLPWPKNAAEPSDLYCNQSANFYLFGGPNPEISQGKPPYFPLSFGDILDGTSNTILFTTCLARYANGDSRVNLNPLMATAPFTASLEWQSCRSHSHQGIALANAVSYAPYGIWVGLADVSARGISAPGGPGTAYGHAILPCDGNPPRQDFP